MMTDMRTIIELDKKQLSALKTLCEAESISRAEAIRRAVDAYTESRRVDNDDIAFGIWSEQKIDGLKQQQKLRNEWE